MYRVKIKTCHPSLKQPKVCYKEFELLEDALEYADSVSEFMVQSIEIIMGIVEELSSDGNWITWRDEDGYTSDEYTMVNGKIIRIV